MAGAIPGLCDGTCASCMHFWRTGPHSGQVLEVQASLSDIQDTGEDVEAGIQIPASDWRKEDARQGTFQRS